MAEDQSNKPKKQVEDNSKIPPTENQDRDKIEGYTKNAQPSQKKGKQTKWNRPKVISIPDKDSKTITYTSIGAGG